MSQAITITTITTLVRYIIDDILSTGSDIETVETATSNIFTISEPNVVAVSDVLVNDVSSGVVYTYSSSTNKVTITSSLSVDDTVEIQYTFYNNYSNTEIEAYIRSAVVHISINGYANFKIETEEFYPTPEENEKNLIAMIAGILIEPNNISYRLPDMSINVSKGALTTNDMIRKTIALFKGATGGMLGRFDIVGQHGTGVYGRRGYSYY